MAERDKDLQFLKICVLLSGEIVSDRGNKDFAIINKCNVFICETKLQG